ncbi:MAG: TonB-dependent receptor [Pseudomonadota bacterium]|nr:TonB-dependent receptor [Pseudomonadota bacterium]
MSSVTAAVLTALYGAPSSADQVNVDEATLQEVVVTATRRAVSAQDLPIAITAVSGARLDEAGIVDIAGLAHSMAGVNYTDKGPFGGVAGANLIIRGLNSETTSGLPAGASPVVPPVATYVDDTPLLVNLRLQDLDRVEVLRGPQGTLYGSGSLGGTIRFVQNAPDPSAFDAKIEADVSKTAHTHELNEDVKGMLNLPFSDTFAVRLNTGWTDEAGFINQPNLYKLDSSGVPVAATPGAVFSDPVVYDKQGVNSYQYRTARVAALFKPSEDFHAQLSYYHQLSAADGFPYVATSLAGYNQPVSPSALPVGDFTNPPAVSQYYNGPVPAGVDRLSSPENMASTTHDTVDMAALTLEYDMGFATLTSASSWAHHVNRTTADETAEYENFYGFPQDLYGQNPRMFIVGKEAFDDKPWSQELRLASKSGGKLEWVGGLFFKNQTTAIKEDDYYPGYYDFYNACAPIYGPSPADFNTPSYCGVGDTAYVPGQTTVVNGITVNKDEAFVGDFNTKFKEIALFGELTGHVTSAWSVTGGARVFKQTLTQNQATALLFLAAPQFGSPPTNMTSGDSWRRALWKFNTSYQFDKDNLAYATWSQGFRRGSVNALPSTAGGFTVPSGLFKVEPDTADNYEVGIKGTVANHFRYSAAIYDIQWHKVQEEVQLTALVLPGVLNVGEAYSRGLETELDAVLSSHITAHLGYTYDITKLTQLSDLYVYPNVAGAAPAVGSRLPGTPLSSAAVTLEYGHVPLAGGELRYAIDAHYQSAVLSGLSASIPPVRPYTMLDTRLSFTASQWTATAYVHNLTNNLGITSYQDPSVFGNRYMAIVSQPRTVGLTLGYSVKGW